MTPRAGWSALLDELELAASIGTDDVTPVAATPGSWSPPTDLGPMPIDLIDRAEAVARQLALAEGLARRQHGEIGAELAALRRRTHHSARELPSSALDAFA